MSWDAVLLRTKGKPTSIEEMEELPLGKRADVLAAIRAEFPTVKTQGSQLIYSDGELSIEFVFQGRNPVESVMLEVHGAGDPITPVLRLATANGWVVLDLSSSELLDPAKPDDNAFGGYRKLVERGARKRPPKRPKK